MIRSLTQDSIVRSLLCAFLVAGLSLGSAADAATITLTVETTVTDPNTGVKSVVPVEGFRYLVEKDTTHKPDPGTVDLNSLSFRFHRSHNPVATNSDGQGISGETLTDTATILDVPDGDYFVSILPFSGHSLGGGAVSVTGGDTGTASKNVRVSRYPLPAAQISVWVFHDNNPVNGSIDLDEIGLACDDTGNDGCGPEDIPFTIKLFDAAGQYGAAGGHVTWDMYGNPLGTEYQQNADGSVATDIDGNPVITSVPEGDAVNGFVLKPNADGQIVIRNLPPAKYGVQVVPPAGAGWIQTSTIEGGKTIDAWVKANEPEVFVEFGPPGPHVFVGFVKEFDCLNAPDANCDTDLFPQPAAGSGATISGYIVNNHLARPNLDPSNVFSFSNGEFFEGCRIAVNIGISGRTLVSKPCGDGAFFEVSNLPGTVDGIPSSYSLSIWDDGLNAVIANHPFTISGNSDDGFEVAALFQNGTVPGGPGVPHQVFDCTAGNCDLGQVPVFDWFHFLDTAVFNDENENGIWDEGEEPLHADASATNIRFRDGRIYTGLAIDFEGGAPLEEVFPFFHWLVAEVDFANFKATGATMITDNGGHDDSLQDRGYVPQLQGADACLEADDATSLGNCTTPAIPTLGLNAGEARVETGPVLTQAFQGFLGQKNTILWGKKSYGEGENGGISGVAIYAITRAEDDPRYAAAEEWEPGIPRLQVALYEDFDNDEVPDDLNDNGTVDLPDVDNYPLGWAEGGAMGMEDVDQSCALDQAACVAANPGFDQGDAREVTWTDSWDDSEPSNCQGANNLAGLEDDRCFDGLRNWNQLRPGVFDGGYAFGGDAPHLPTGYYIVQAFTPPGYELMAEEHKNVDFGDEYRPQLLPPICVGASHTIPKLLAHLSAMNGDPLPGVDVDDPDNWSPYYQEDAGGVSLGIARPSCDAKHIRVADGKNAAADFHFLTRVPKAAHVVGGVINDFGNEFNPNAPTFGEKFAPPWLPVAFYDWEGNEITRVYTDQYGKYNAMLPSTYTVNIASPSGVAPNMISACMNDSGLIDSDGDGMPDTPDPRHNPQYSQFCYTFQYMPGGTTYLDTPVTQLAAFAGSGFQLDCDAADATPMIKSVTSPGYVGPYAPGGGTTLTIESVGPRSVPNPSASELDINRLVERDYGFGDNEGSVVMRPLEVWSGGADAVIPLAISSWTDTSIDAVVPSDVGGSAPRGRYQLEVVHDNGNVSPMGVTVLVGPLPLRGRVVIQVLPSNAAGATPIQDALDQARRGDLILVAAGTYDEAVIMYEPVYLQGAGAYSTTINARAVPAEKVQNWQDKVWSLLNDDLAFNLLPGQELVNPLFPTEAGAGLSVFAPAAGANRFANGAGRRSTFDGFTVTGASTGGGIFVNGYVNGLQISNNQITSNEGTYGGGIRLGHYNLTVNGDNLAHTDAENDNVWIHHNLINRNGIASELGAGAGIALYSGSQNYRITENSICGNFSSTDGGGVGHLGYSNNGLIEDNRIVFNQSFRQTPGLDTDGGGIFVGGHEGIGGQLSEGSGHVLISRNLIQGNQAGAGDGGGIMLRRVNGQDVVAAFESPGNGNVHGQFDRVRIYNNTIVNNAAGGAGGAISIREAVRTDILSNTIANNISTATAGSAFDGTTPGVSVARVAGIVSHAYQAGGIGSLLDPARLPTRLETPFGNPLLRNNVVWHNRPYHFDVNQPAGSQLIEESFYLDLGVQGVVGQMDPRWSLLSLAAGYHSSNSDDGDLASGDPFARQYLNGSPGTGPSLPSEFTTVQAAPALDEGGNWIDVRYAPLSINDVDGAGNPSDYHLATGDLVDAGHPTNNRPGGLDIDLEPGNAGVNDRIDIGSDEVQP